MTRSLPLVESDRRVNFVNTEKCRTLSIHGAAVWGRPLVERIGGVDSVHTLGHGLGRTRSGLGRIPYVWAGDQCLQGLEPGSSPTSGTEFPQVRGLFVHIVHTLASDLMFRGVWGPGNSLFGCVGEWLSTADRVPPCGVSCWCSSWLVLSLGFRVHHFMVARTAYNMIRSLSHRSTYGCGRSRIFALTHLHAGMRVERHDFDPAARPRGLSGGLEAGGAAGLMKSSIRALVRTSKWSFSSEDNL
jgi:hypothetical protein